LFTKKRTAPVIAHVRDWAMVNSDNCILLRQRV